MAVYVVITTPKPASPNSTTPGDATQDSLMCRRGTDPFADLTSPAVLVHAGHCLSPAASPLRRSCRFPSCRAVFGRFGWVECKDDLHNTVYRWSAVPRCCAEEILFAWVVWGLRRCQQASVGADRRGCSSPTPVRMRRGGS